MNFRFCTYDLLWLQTIVAARMAEWHRVVVCVRVRGMRLCDKLTTRRVLVVLQLMAVIVHGVCIVAAVAAICVIVYVIGTLVILWRYMSPIISLLMRWGILFDSLLNR